MNMKTFPLIRALCRPACRVLLGIALSPLLLSCSAINDDEGDCTPRWDLSFRYDHNMKYADVFAREVPSLWVRACGHDAAVTLTEQGAPLQNASYRMRLPSALGAGACNLAVWGGLDVAESKDSGTAASSPARFRLDGDTCRLTGLEKEGDSLVLRRDIAPLFASAGSVALPSDEGHYTWPVGLMKCTNGVHIVLQSISNVAVDMNKFRFAVVMTGGDELLPGGEPLKDHARKIHYLPYKVQTYAAERDGDLSSKASVLAANCVAVDLALPRLMEGSDARLVVTTREGRTLLSVLFVRYALLARPGHYDTLSPQEYLDREDEWSMTFFLDEDNMWNRGFIYINSWKVMPPQDTDLGH